MASQQPSEITEKQKRFCDEYLLDYNGTKAAIRAGYSEKTANEQASRLLTFDKIKEYIAQRRTELNKQVESKYTISREIVLNQYWRLAFSDIRNLYDEDGTLKPIHQLDDDTAAALAAADVYEEFEYPDGQKVQVGQTKKVKLYDKLRALDSISKVMGYNAEEKTNVRVTVDLTEKDIELFAKFFNEKYK